LVDWVGAGGSCLRVIRICIAILQSGGAWVVRFVAALLVVLFVLFNGDGESVYILAITWWQSFPFMWAPRHCLL